MTKGTISLRPAPSITCRREEGRWGMAARPMATPSDDLVLLAFLNQGLMYNSPIETPRRPVELLVEEVRRQFANDHEPFQRAFLFVAPCPGKRAFRLW